jgi:uncharacterized protein (DUF433 family)
VGKVLDIYGGRDPRELPLYAVGEAAHYLRMPSATLANWLRGSRRVLNLPPGSGRMSFQNLVEAHILLAIRRFHKVPMQRVRPAIDFCKKRFHTQHPLVTEDFHTNGLDLFVKKVGAILNVSQGGQTEMRSALEISLRRVERDTEGLAARLFPFVRDWHEREQPRSIVVDPAIAFGAPVIAGTGIATSVVAGRMRAGETIELIAADYGITGEQVQDAVRCEIREAA